jgi:SSS family transporter
MMPEINLHAFDWIALALYVLVTFGIALRVRFGQKSQADYYLAGRSSHWILIGVSMYATLFSTVSFVSMPGEGYKHGMLMSLQSVGYTLFTPLAVWMFLRFFYNTTSFTAYEYLERRFDLNARTLGAVAFIVLRALYGALVFFAASKAFETLVGWPPVMTICVVGSITIAYSYIGGMRAIIITDFVQTMVILGGLLVIIFKVSSLVGFDYAAVWRFAAAHDHTFNQVSTPEFWSLDPKLRYTFWTWLLLALTAPLTNYGTDQLVVQRILSSKSYGDAKKAIILKTVGALPFSLLFYFTGVLLFFYFNNFTAPPGVEADGMLGYFINQFLPSPLPGLIAAALLAALMSTFDSTLNSLSTVFAVDVLQRRGWVAPDVDLLQLGKRLTLGWGVVMLGLALFLAQASRGVESTIAEVASILTCLWGVLLVVVMAGIFTRWATARAATWALLLGGLINLYVPWKLYYGTAPEERISFVWVGVPGWIAALVVIAIVSFFDSRQRRNLDGLTWSTIRNPERAGHQHPEHAGATEPHAK